MADICMCSGSGCSRKDSCHRHTAQVNEYRQSMFVNPPAKEDGSCDSYWSNAGYRVILNQFDKFKENK